MTLQRKNPRKGARWLTLLTIVMLAAVVGPVAPVFATVSSDAGFDGADGDLVGRGTATTGLIDWNDFDPTAWTTDTAPYRKAATEEHGWKFTGLEDAQSSGTDTVFAGGVKQDDSCATVNSGPKPPNKDDLKRIYVATGLVGTDIFLALAWVRIPQNTTSASAHVGFEFNQADPSVAANQCGGSAGLVKRTADDMLIVYDFEGGASTPTLKLLKWKTSGTDPCEAGGTPTVATPCWVFAADLTGDGDADGEVNVGATALDTIGPAGPNPGDILGDSEFGEAIINLTAADIFTANTCTTFGSVFGVSRSSGNSAKAQMKDLVGPGNPNLTNCGEITIIKNTSPRGVDTAFPFTSTIAGSQLSCVATAATAGTPKTLPSFNLNDKSIAITNTVANPTVVTATGHGFVNGQSVTISGSSSTPAINSTYTISNVTTNTFTVPVNVTVAGSTGKVVGNSARNTEKCVNVPIGTYTVTEGNDPSGFVFNNFSCTATGGATTAPESPSTTSKTVSITMTGGGAVTCTYTNDQRTSSGITAQKVYPNDSATFTPSAGTLSGSVTFTLYSNLTCTGTVLYTQTITDITTGTLGTDGKSLTVETTNYPPNSSTYAVTAPGTTNLSWQAVFTKSSSGTVLGSSAPCESTVITIDNDTTQ